MKTQQPISKRMLGVSAVAVGLASALYVSNKARRSVEENPPKGRFLNVDGVRLHYIESGVGPPVILLHGNAVSHADFLSSGLFSRLAATHRVIAFDRPGYGHSPRPNTTKWTPKAQAELMLSALRPLGIAEPAVVVGHSMGTVVALEMALTQAAVIKKLVLIAGYFYPERRLDVAFAAPLTWPYVGTALLYTIAGLSTRLLFNRIVKGIFAPDTAPAHFVPLLSQELMLRPSQLRASAEDAEYLRPAALEMYSKYPSLEMPVTIVAGGKDPVVDPEAHSIRLHGDIVQSNLILKPLAGHMVHYTAVDEIVANVTASKCELNKRATTPLDGGARYDTAEMLRTHSPDRWPADNSVADEPLG